MKYTILLLLAGLKLQAQLVLGIDVSHHQDNIDWRLVANDGKIFAFAKATEGYTYDDPNFQTYMVNGTNSGIIMGAYHFARPDNNSALDEANHFVNIAKNYIGNNFLPPVLDLEDPNSYTHLDQLYTSSQLTEWVKTWLDEVQNQTGVQPILYLNSNYANFLDSSLNEYQLWIAKPGTEPDTDPDDIGNWNNWAFKQYSWEGNVNGISGYVDLNSYNGTLNEFNEMIENLNTQSFENQKPSLYPNPVINKLFIKTNLKTDIKQVKIFDLNGRLLNDLVSYNENYVDLSDLSPGIYIIHLLLSNNTIYTTKIIKSRE